MSISQIQLTDTFSQWMGKDNQMITAVNALAASGTVLEITSPTTGQILVFDGNFFRNVAISGDLALNSAGATTVIGGASGLSKGRMRFAGAMTSIY